MSRRRPRSKTTTIAPWPSAVRGLVLRATLRFGVCLVLLLLPWPGAGTLYGRAIAAVLDLFGSLTFPVTLSFAPPQEGSWKLLVHAQDAISGRVVDTTLDLRRTTYLGSAVFSALVMALPLTPRARVGLLLRGLPLLTSLVALPLLAFFSGPLPVQAFPVGRVPSALLQLLYHVLVAPPGMAYALPALLLLTLLWRHRPETDATTGSGP